MRDAEASLLERLRASAGHKRVLPISAATRDNCDVLMRRLRKLLTSAKIKGPPLTPTEPQVRLDERESESDRNVEVVQVDEGEWRLTGSRIEKAASMTNWDYAEAQDRFQRIMRALGASDKLKAAGAKNGDIIMVGNVDFSYFEETPMAARARLAGFRDDGEEGLEHDDLEDAARRLARELDDELLELLDGDGDVLTF